MTNSVGAFKISIVNNDCSEENGTSIARHTLFFIVRDFENRKGYVKFLYLSNSKDITMEGEHIRLKNPNETMIEYFDNLQKETNGYWLERIIYDFDQIIVYGRFSYQEVENLDDLTSKYFHAQTQTNKEISTDEQVVAFPGKNIHKKEEPK